MPITAPILVGRGTTTLITQIIDNLIKPNQLISGEAIWVTGLDFFVTDCVFTINGILYSSAAETVTLATADVTNPRIDVIAVNIDGTADVVTGTAAATPVKPEIDSDTQIEVTFALVAAGATTPSNVTNEDVYLENAEWTAADSGATINPDDLSAPFAGTKAIKFTAAVDTNFLTLTDSATHSATEFDRFFFYIKNTVANTVARNRLQIALYNSTLRVSNWIDLRHGDYGFDGSDITNYQLITIPITDFGLAGNSFNVVRFQVEAAGANTLSFLLDNIKFQTGAPVTDGTPTNIFMPAVANVEALTSRDPVYLVQDGREGVFRFDSSNLSTEVAADTRQGIYIAPASAPTGASGAWVRVYEGPIYPEWFGAVGDGVTNDQAALQATIDFVGTFLVGPNFEPGAGAAIALTRQYYCLTGLVIDAAYDGIELFGQGKGAVLLTDQNITLLRAGVDLSGGGDTTGQPEIFGTKLNKIFFRHTGATNTATAVQFGLAKNRAVTDCVFDDFYIGIDEHRGADGVYTRCRFVLSNRTTEALASIRLQGVYNSTNSHTPGGGLHITDCEFVGFITSPQLLTQHLLVKSVDGIYITQCHFNGYKNGITLAPDGTDQNNKIIDIYISNCYFDGDVNANGSSVSIGGSVDDITANGITGLYQGVNFSNCLFRGGGNSDYGVVVSVADAGAFAANKELKGITFKGCTFYQHRLNAIALSGVSASRIEAKGVLIDACYFHDGRYSAAGGVSAINAECRSISVTGCTFEADQNAPAWVVNFTLSTTGATDTGDAVALLKNNIFSSANYSSAPYLLQTDSAAYQYDISDNIFPVGGETFNIGPSVGEVEYTYFDVSKQEVVPSSAGAIADQVAGANNRLIYKYIPFDGTTQEGAVIWWKSPKRWNGGTIAYRVVWKDVTAAVGKATRWVMQAYATSDGDDFNIVNGTGVAVVDDTTGNATHLLMSAWSAPVTIAGTPVGDDLVGAVLSRTPTDAADTLDAVDARLLGVEIAWSSNKLTDQ